MHAAQHLAWLFSLPVSPSKAFVLILPFHLVFHVASSMLIVSIIPIAPHHLSLGSSNEHVGGSGKADRVRTSVPTTGTDSPVSRMHATAPIAMPTSFAPHRWRFADISAGRFVGNFDAAGGTLIISLVDRPVTTAIVLR